MEKIELRKVRDFGALFNDGIAFLRVNFKSFFGTLIYLAGPFIIFTGLISGYMQSLQHTLMMNNLFSGWKFGSGFGLLSANFIGTLSIFILISLLTTLVTTACICLYFKEYDKADSGNLPLSRAIISPQLAPASWRLFYNTLLFGVLMSIAGLIVVGVFAAMFMVPVLNIIAGIALVLGLLIGMPVFIQIVYSAFYLVVRDEILITEAFVKSVRYVKGNFWWTWLLIIAVGISVATVASIFNLPLTIVTLTQTFTRLAEPGSTDTGSTLVYVIFGAISMIGQLLVISPVFYTFCILNYHNQEERHEGTGLLSRIDELDTN
jgi:hypothetical protein